MTCLILSARSLQVLYSLLQIVVCLQQLEQTVRTQLGDGVLTANATSCKTFTFVNRPIDLVAVFFTVNVPVITAGSLKTP